MVVVGVVDGVGLGDDRDGIASWACLAPMEGKDAFTLEMVDLLLWNGVRRGIDIRYVCFYHDFSPSIEEYRGINQGS